MKILGRLGHVARYLAGAAAAGAVFLAQAAGLVIPYAILTAIGSGLLGAILGLLFGFLLAFLVGLLAVTLIIFPATLLAELIARRTHWGVAPLAMLGLLLTFTALATAAWQPADGGTGFALSFAAMVLPAIAFGLVAYPAEWLTVSLIAFAKRHGPRLMSRLKALPGDASPPSSHLAPSPPAGQQAPIAPNRET